MLKRVNLATILAATLAGTAHADIFKCTVDGKSVYQASPCVTEESEKALKIRTTTTPQYKPSAAYPAAEPARPGESPIMAQERQRLERELKQAQIRREQASAEFNRSLANEASTRQWEAERNAELREKELELQRQRDLDYNERWKHLDNHFGTPINRR
jgi:hypothetical protein